MSIKNKRIWELDAFRGLCIIGVIFVHTIYDLQMFNMIESDMPMLYNIVKNYGGLLFVVLSGICVTLGRHSLRRGCIVFACGLVITLVTYGMYRFDFAGKGIMIHFGVLHLLGICMILYSLYKKLPAAVIGVIGLGIIFLSLYFDTIRSEAFWYVPLGIRPYGYVASDYFPLVPNLGWFMVGVVLGRIVYRKKESLFPSVPSDIAPIRALSFCGRHSLWIYMGHQPIVYGIIYLIYMNAR